METVISADGTPIAFDRHRGTGAGDTAPTVILIGGVFSYRAFPKMVSLAETLAARHGLTVINYDRRGRGDSGDGPGGHGAEGEIDDLAALVDAAGGAVSLFGWSSGAGLALRAAASGRIPGIERVVAFEPPFVVNRERHVPPADFGETLHELVAADRRSDTVRHFMTKGMGIPGIIVGIMRITPFWPKLTAVARSAPYDWAVMGEFMRGEPLAASDWEGVAVPVLVLAGAKTEPLLRTAARAIAEVLPDAEHREVPGLSHNPKIEVLVSAAAEFLSDPTSRTSAPASRGF